MVGRSPGLKRSPRTVEGERIAIYMKAKGWQQKRLAEEIGVSPAVLNDMLAGRKSLGIERLNKIVQALGNCTLTDLQGTSAPQKWSNLQRMFVDAISARLDLPWYFFDDYAWPAALPEECLPKAGDCFAMVLRHVGAFSLSVDFMGIRPLLANVITFVERAYGKNVRDAGRMLFDSCDRMVHCLTFTLPPVPLKTVADQYLSKMAQVFEDTHDQTLGKRLRFVITHPT